MKRIFAITCLLLTLGMLTQRGLAQSWNSSGPIPRALHSAVLDTSTNRMIVFGGLPADTTSQQNLNDLWRLNATGGTNLNWMQIHPAGTPPTGRFGHSAVYDRVNNRMIVFGGAEGRSSPCANDAWVLTNANGNGGTPTWSQLTTAGSPPSPRAVHGGVYDPNTNTLIIYGGQDCFSTIFGDVWVLSNANGLGGTPTWTQLSTAGGGPGQREIGPNVAYDSTNNRLIVFGGGNGNGNGRTNDVWVLSNANGSGGTPTWAQLSPTGTLPPARGNGSVTYDSSTNRLTIFGGDDSSNNLLGDAWVLTNANGLGGTPAWTQIASSSVVFPEPRAAQTAVYQPSTNKMTIFGGQNASSGSYPFTNDVFVLSHANGH